MRAVEPTLRERLLSYARAIGESRYRGLLVAHSASPGKAAREIIELLSGHGHRGCIAAAPRRLLPSCPPGCRCISPGGFQRVLGQEAQLVVIATDGLLRPNLVAGLAGVVSAGGLLAIVTPPLDQWNPGPAGGAGGYRRYLLGALRRAPVIFWADIDLGKVYAERRPRERAREWRLGAKDYKPRHAVPRVLLGLAATRSQAQALDEFASFLSSRSRSFLLTGDRGRGKSFLLGLAAALAVKRGSIGEAVAVAPSPASLTSFFQGLVRGLDALSIGYRVKQRGGDIVAVTGPWFRIAYQPMDSAKPAAVLVVDEAGTVGVSRLRRLSWRSGRILVATTIHGYEGSGRVFVHMVEEVLPRPLKRLELEEPIRYPPGDPLEEWVNETFMLKFDPGSLSLFGEPGYEQIPAEKLASDHALLRQVYSLLALAHYRSEPDYLLVLLESNTHTLHVLHSDNKVIAVADVGLEDWEQPEEGRVGLLLLSLHTEGAKRLRAARIVRIAVHPELQRRGLGSKLLSYVEEWARGRGVDLVMAVFGRHDVIEFWLRAGYTPFYVSPRFNKYTGEKNIGVAKPFTGAGKEALEEAARELRLRLLFSAHSVYRDLATEKIVMLLQSLPSVDPPVSLTPGQRRRLCKHIQGFIEAEQAFDALHIATIIVLSRRDYVDKLNDRQLLLATARLLQGKPPHEAAEIAGIPLENLDEELHDLAESVATMASIKCS
ncbi:GNAT family N-acetyltransferase [Pyrodictium delaneyi]|uniref:tRNA(Met) cytidine acetyltransferase TmcA n=1 Tax=Pyrodictium delaneyi TaxID=1273541 RepID=A0A211YPB2_9CREN|nr:GNAT family N-acetyltransferase [Pyrodictium delaneyi]OWJ54829.1 hypothetical protein Pdsh_03695 [Pyrodictium delaneyi]